MAENSYKSFPSFTDSFLVGESPSLQYGELRGDQRACMTGDAPCYMVNSHKYKRVEINHCLGRNVLGSKRPIHQVSFRKAIAFG